MHIRINHRKRARKVLHEIVAFYDGANSAGGQYFWPRMSRLFKSRFKPALTSLGLGGTFALGVLLVLLLLASFERGRQALLNPFGFSTKVTPSGPVVLEQLQKMARLETARYKGHTIVKGHTGSDVLPSFIAGDKLVFIGHGEVVAGVDLGKMQPQDVRVNGDKVTIKLPAAEVFHSRLDNEQSEVFERQTGVFSKPDQTLETRVRQEAEKQIRDAALESEVLQHAAQGAREALRKQLGMLGFGDVEFE